MAHREVWAEAQVLAGGHRQRQFLLPPPFFYPQSFPPESCVGCLDQTREGVSSMAELPKRLHQLHANRCRWQSSLHTLAWEWIR